MAQTPSLAWSAATQRKPRVRIAIRRRSKLLEGEAALGAIVRLMPQSPKPLTGLHPLLLLLPGALA
eukprot:3309248-Amphidinium_carterae.1